MIDSSPSSSSPRVLFQAKNITVSIDERVILKQTSLEVFAGDSVAIMGKSGTGKSLFLKILAQLIPFSSGEIFFLQKQVDQYSIPAYRTQVHYLSQTPSLMEGSVADNIYLAMQFKANQRKALQEKEKKDRKEKLHKQILKWLHLLEKDESFLRKRADNLSGGEAQLTNFLRSLILSPTLLLLDEPTSALDAHHTLLVEKLVSNFLQENSQRAIILVTHDDRQAHRLCQRFVRLREGIFES